MKEVNVYTDGSCLKNPGPGGWSVVFEEEDFIWFDVCGVEAETTNNRMEMTAVLNALKWVYLNAEEHSVNRVTIHSDSAYVINALTKGWLKGWKKRGWQKASGDPVLNEDIWREIDKALQRAENVVEVVFVKVKGHAGNEMNEKADMLARSMAASCK